MSSQISFDQSSIALYPVALFINLFADFVFFFVTHAKKNSEVTRLTGWRSTVTYLRCWASVANLADDLGICLVYLEDKQASTSLKSQCAAPVGRPQPLSVKLADPPTPSGYHIIFDFIVKERSVS